MGSEVRRYRPNLMLVRRLPVRSVAEINISSQISCCHPRLYKSPVPVASEQVTCVRRERRCCRAPSPGPCTLQIPRVQGTEGVNDKKKFSMCSQCRLSAGVSEAEFDKMAAAKFSMCRLEVKCN